MFRGDCSMVRLKNIKRTDKTIEADYYPETTDEKGFILMDCETQEIIDCQTTSYDCAFDTYLIHAQMELIRLATAEKVPTERTVLWY